MAAKEQRKRTDPSVHLMKKIESAYEVCHEEVLRLSFLIVMTT